MTSELSKRIERQSQTYLDLKELVHDLRNMTVVLETVMEADLGDARTKEDGFIKILLSQEQFDSVHFAAAHVAGMAKQLFKVWEADGRKEGSDG